MDKELKLKAKQIHEQSKVKSLLTGYSFGALCILFFMFLLLDSLIGFLLIVLLLFPLYFAFTLIHLSFSYENNLNLSSIIQYFKMYFRRPNNGVFEIFLNLLKAIGVSILLSIVSSLIGLLICSFINDGAIQRAMETVMNLTMSGQEFDLVLALGDDYEIFYLFELISTLPPALLSSIYFIYKINRASLAIYFRLSYPKSDPMYLKQVFTYTNKKYKKEIGKDYWSLNWPLYLLLTIGVGAGAFIGLQIHNNFDFASSFALITGSLLMLPYLPYYFSNKEALYSKYEQIFVTCSLEVTNSFLKNLQSRIELNEEEKRALEQMLNKLENPLEENDEKEDEDIE